MGNAETRVLFGSLARGVFPIWDRIDRAYQRRLRERMLAVMEIAVSGEFRRFLRRDRAVGGRTGEPTWTIIENPLAGLHDQRSLEWRRMRKRVERFIAALRGDT